MLFLILISFLLWVIPCHAEFIGRYSFLEHECPFIPGQDVLLTQVQDGCYNLNGYTCDGMEEFRSVYVDCGTTQSIHIYNVGDCIDTPFKTYFIEPAGLHLTEDDKTLGLGCEASK